MAKFKKGDSVFKFGTWDCKGMFFSQRLIIQSCGAKRATAVHEVDGQMIKCFIYPAEYEKLVHVAELPTAEAVAEEGKKRAAQYVEFMLELNINKRGNAAYNQASIEKEIKKFEGCVPGCAPIQELMAQRESKI